METNEGTSPDQPAVPTGRLMKLRYQGRCTSCHAVLAPRAEAWWYRDEKKIVCTTCQPVEALPGRPGATKRDGSDPDEPEILSASPTDTEAPAVGATAAAVESVLTVDGEAGASARREGERRRTRREQRTMNAHPRLGKLILAVSDEPQSVRSWSTGAVGEETLGAKLNKHASQRRVMLHDRRIPGSKANIDHVAVTPGGVFVIDAKHYSGQVEKRNLGNIFRSDVRLYVGRRECTKLLHGVEDQAEVVRDALAPLGFSGIPVRPVLCFVAAEWGFFASPFKLGSVLVTHPKFLQELLQKDAEVETAAIQETAAHLVEILRRA